MYFGDFRQRKPSRQQRHYWGICQGSLSSVKKPRIYWMSWDNGARSSLMIGLETSRTESVTPRNLSGQWKLTGRHTIIQCYGIQFELKHIFDNFQSFLIEFFLCSCFVCHLRYICSGKKKKKKINPTKVMVIPNVIILKWMVLLCSCTCIFQLTAWRPMVD